MRKPKWFRTKGYLHLTPSLTVTDDNWRKFYARISNPKFVASYAFFPLIHRVIENRRYKKGDPEKSILKGGKRRAHSHRQILNGGVQKNIKERPLHYASHFDSLIYAYYANQLGKNYEKLLDEDDTLNAAVIAYRSIPISKSNRKGKSNIHFAKELFDEIERRTEVYGETAVLALDLKSFFSSLDHDILYEKWARIINSDTLPPHHLNVFRSCTNFSYVLYDDLKKNRRGFDESKLAEIRKKHGYRCFFESNDAFRKAIKSGKLPIYKNPFFTSEKVNGRKKRKGIPQGLPLSAVLANLYLYDFDKQIVDKLVNNEGMFYRRYSDDIVILCSLDKLTDVNQFISELIAKYRVEISTDKTERFIFRKMAFNQLGQKRVTSIRLNKSNCVIDSPLTYLGFEYRGYNTVIKSTNLSKFYRRLISIVKSRARRARQLSDKDPTVPYAIYINQIKKLYNAPLKYVKAQEINKTFRRRYRLVPNDRGEFDIVHEDPMQKRSSNYITYIRRCDKIFETESFSKQIHKKRHIIGEAIKRHLINKG